MVPNHAEFIDNEWKMHIDDELKTYGISVCLCILSHLSFAILHRNNPYWLRNCVIIFPSRTTSDTVDSTNVDLFVKYIATHSGWKKREREAFHMRMRCNLDILLSTQNVPGSKFSTWKIAKLWNVQNPHRNMFFKRFSIIFNICRKIYVDCQGNKLNLRHTESGISFTDDFTKKPVISRNSIDLKLCNAIIFLKVIPTLVGAIYPSNFNLLLFFCPKNKSILPYLLSIFKQIFG